MHIDLTGFIVIVRFLIYLHHENLRFLMLLFFCGICGVFFHGRMEYLGASESDWGETEGVKC